MRLRRKQAVAGVKPRCETCEDIELRRHARVGFFQRVVLARIGYYPWECGLCRKITFLPQRFSVPGGQRTLEAASCAETPVRTQAASQLPVPLREPLLQTGIGPHPSVAAR